MALLFCDSFDHYAIGDILQKWTQLYPGAMNGTALISANGRRSTNSLRSGWTTASSANRARFYGITLSPSGTTFIVGFSLCVTNALSSWSSLAYDLVTTDTSSAFFTSIRNSGATLMWMRPNPDGTISLYRGTTLLATSVNALSIGTTYYIEWKGALSTTAGSTSVRVNGVEWLTYSGNTGGSAWNEFTTGCPDGPGGSNTNNWFDYDDLYICDGSGSNNNDFLGDIRVDAVLPTSDGSNSSCTPSTGTTHYALVDEASTNGDTDYNSAVNVGDKDTLNFPSAPSSGDILAIQVNMMARKEDAGAAGLKAVARIGSTDYVGSEIAPSTTYSDCRQIWEVKPDGSSAVWSTSDFDSAEFGYEKST